MNNPAKTLATICLAFIFPVVFLSCKKEYSLPTEKAIPAPERTQAPTAVQPQLHASVTSVQLTQANATRTAISLEWTGFPGAGGESKDYHIEASIAGAQSNNWVEIGSTNQTNFDFTAEEFNKQICKLFVTGLSENVCIRVKLSNSASGPVYSYSALLEVTTYQPVTDYDDKRVFRIPGNFQNWKVETAPTIVSKGADGEYEGYINFTDAGSQFLMVRADRVWNPLTTLYNIGAGKFGFGGNIFGVPSGAGIYKFNASTNTNTWSCTKIDSWTVSGTAVTTDVAMQFNGSNKVWEITGNFNKGSFVFRANGNNKIVFGHNPASEVGVPDYNGANIEIGTTGNYTIRLSLLSAGNYSYSILRNP